MRFGIRVGTAWPRTAERIVMAMRAVKAAEKTSRRGCFMAISAAIRKVLSPISENTIIVKERRKECRGWIKELVAVANKGIEGLRGSLIWRGSSLDEVGGRGGGIS